MKNIIGLLSLSFFAGTIYAEENISPAYKGFEGCGDYQISGVISENNHKLFLYINKGTRSEYRFNIPAKEEMTVAPYINKSLEAKLFIKKMNGTIGEIEKIRDTQFHIADPLHPVSDTGFRLIKRRECAQ